MKGPGHDSQLASVRSKLVEQIWLSLCQSDKKVYLRFDALEEVTTVPALARGGEPSIWAKLLRGVDMLIDSASALPLVPKTGRQRQADN